MLTIQVLIISEDSIPGMSDFTGDSSTAKLDHFLAAAFTVFLGRSAGWHYRMPLALHV